jgi:hypothetical protein
MALATGMPVLKTAMATEQYAVDNVVNTINEATASMPSMLLPEQYANDDIIIMSTLSLKLQHCLWQQGPCS